MSAASPGRLRVAQRTDGSWTWSYHEEGSGLVLWGSRPERGFRAALDAARIAFPDADGVVLHTRRVGREGDRPRPGWIRTARSSLFWSIVALVVTIVDLSGWVRRLRRRRFTSC